jgi:hypothetical protein
LAEFGDAGDGSGRRPSFAELRSGEWVFGKIGA